MPLFCGRISPLLFTVIFRRFSHYYKLSDLIVTFIRRALTFGRPSSLIQTFKFRERPCDCPARGLMPQRLCSGSLAEVDKTVYCLNR